MKTRTLAITLLFLAAAFAGCSGSDSDEAADPIEEEPTTNQLWVLHLEVGDSYSFNTTGTTWELVGGTSYQSENWRWVSLDYSLTCPKYSIQAQITYAFGNGIPIDDSPIIPIGNGFCTVTLTASYETLAYFQPHEVVPFTGE